jgi:uncharacterized protein
MNRRMSILVLASVLFAFCATGLLRAGEEAPPARDGQGAPLFLWEVSAPKATAWVTGTVHAAKPSLYPLDKVFYETLAGADVLVVELDPLGGDLLKMQQFMLQRAMLPPGTTLEELLTPETLELLKAYLRERGLGTSLGTMRPWFMAMQFTMQEAQRHGFQPGFALDLHLIQRAKALEVPLVELETMQAQIGLLSGLDKVEQDLFLRQTLLEAESFNTEMTKLLSAWKRGNAEAVEAFLTRSLGEDPAVSGIYDKIITRRNFTMAAKVDKLLAQGTRPFVAVGAGHVVGEKGILQLLRRKGYRIRQMRSAAPVEAPAGVSE